MYKLFEMIIQDFKLFKGKYQECYLTLGSVAGSKWGSK